MSVNSNRHKSKVSSVVLEQNDVEDVNIFSMIGIDLEGESMVLVSDFQSTRCLLEDFKVVKINNTQVGLVQTKIAVAIRFCNRGLN